MTCAMKTACCGKSLLSVSNGLLFFILILDVLDSCYEKILHDDPIYVYLLSYSKGYSMNGNVFVITRIALRVIEVLVFLGAIISIVKRKPSIPLLIFSFAFILLEIFFCVCAVIELNCADSFEEFYTRSLLVTEDKVLSSQKPDSLEDSDEYSEYSNANKYLKVIRNSIEIRKIRLKYSTTFYFLNFAFAVILILKAYSALVIYSCIKELEERIAHDFPHTQQDVYYNAERNTVSEPPATTSNAVQFIQPHLYLQHPYPETAQFTHRQPYRQAYPQYPVQPSVCEVRSN